MKTRWFRMPQTDRQTVRQTQMNGETKDSAGQGAQSGSLCRQPFPDPPCWSPAQVGAGVALQPPPHTRPSATAFHLTAELQLPSCFLTCLQREACFRFPGLAPYVLLPSRLYCPLCQRCCHPADSPGRKPDNFPGPSYALLLLQDCVGFRCGSEQQQLVANFLRARRARTAQGRIHRA